MGAFYAKIGHFILMAILLVFSAFFSGTETAYFNLSVREVEQMKKSKHRIPHLVGWLRDRPSHLLGSLLLGNMIVNILFFAVSSTLVVNFRQAYGVQAAVALAALSFAAILMFGEIVPKSLSYANSKLICNFTAIPIYLVMRIFQPLEYTLRFLFLEPSLRLIFGPKKKSEKISEEEFRILIDSCKKHGYISDEENKLFGEVIELGLLKVRHVMLPRVDMTVLDINTPIKEAITIMQSENITKVPVYRTEIDNVVGIVYLRDIITADRTALERLVKEVNFVPEQQKVEKLLGYFRNSGTDTAVVVDEYGGIAGLVKLEDIAEEILGPIEAKYSEEPIEQIGPFKYKLNGNLAVHEWAKIFNVNPTETKYSTVAGLVMNQLGKIPEPGDVVKYKNLLFKIDEVKKHRIVSLTLEFEPIEND